VNKLLSPMDKDSWANTPSHTNIAETAHAGRNEETGRHKAVLAAIEGYVPFLDLILYC
jgi:hypothetical protein